MKKLLGIMGIGLLCTKAFLFGQENAIDLKRNNYASFKGEEIRENIPGESTVMYNEDTLIYVLYIKDLKDIGHYIEEKVKTTQFQEYYIDEVSNGINENKEEAKDFNEQGFEYVKVEFVQEDGTIINTKRNLIRYIDE